MFFMGCSWLTGRIQVYWIAYFGSDPFSVFRQFVDSCSASGAATPDTYVDYNQRKSTLGYRRSMMPNRNSGQPFEPLPEYEAPKPMVAKPSRVSERSFESLPESVRESFPGPMRDSISEPIRDSVRESIPVSVAESISEFGAPEPPSAKPAKVLRFNLKNNGMDDHNSNNDKADIASPAKKHHSTVNDGLGSVRESAMPCQLARAVYDYTQSPDDPHELSFKKDEVFEIISTKGNWYEAENARGQRGIVPSNFVHLMGKA